MHEVPSWTKQYIGIPFSHHGRARDGSDCWGLLVMVFEEQFKIKVPMYDHIKYDKGDDRTVLSQIVKNAAEESIWLSVNPKEARLGDVLLISIYSRPIHVAVVLNSYDMLHILPGSDSVVEEFTGLYWRSKVVGAYRHVQLVN